MNRPGPARAEDGPLAASGSSHSAIIWTKISIDSMFALESVACQPPLAGAIHSAEEVLVDGGRLVRSGVHAGVFGLSGQRA